MAINTIPKNGGGNGRNTRPISNETSPSDSMPSDRIRRIDALHFDQFIIGLV